MTPDLPTRTAIRLMKAFPSTPSENDASLQEVFDQPRYRDADSGERAAIGLRSAGYRYALEGETCWLRRWFPRVVAGGELRGADVLDLGAFTGGRLVRWAERYAFGRACGVDIRAEYADAGERFAAERGVRAEFSTAFAEDLPYADGSFDFVVSTDVFEHVQDVAAALAECRRILRPGGRLLVVCPAFYQPLEAHLTFTTRLPALHWFFSGATLTRAVHTIHAERGAAASWYALGSPELPPGRRLPSLNGITVRRFRRLLAEQSWVVESQNRAPLLTSGRRASKLPFRVLRKAFAVPARLPVLEEVFLDRICFVARVPPGDG